MTIDELEKRKQELLNQKEIELKRQAQGEDNELELLVIEEELMDIAAQIRALSPAQAKRSTGWVKRNLLEYDSGKSSLDQHIYSAWMAENFFSNDEIDEEQVQLLNAERAQLLKAAKTSLALITPRQREFLVLQANGMLGVEIADKLGLDRSGVATTIRRAKKGAKAAADWLMGGGQIISMDDPGVMEKVLVALTPWQAAHFYLFYSEGWTEQQIADLNGKLRANIEWHTRLARYRLSVALGGENIALVHTEALDRPAYQMLCEMKGNPELIPDYIPVPQYPQGPSIRIIKNEKKGWSIREAIRCTGRPWPRNAPGYGACIYRHPPQAET